jgi:hypothetical protein
MMEASDILDKTFSTDIINTRKENVLDASNDTFESVEREENMFQFISRMNKEG